MSPRVNAAARPASRTTVKKTRTSPAEVKPRVRRAKKVAGEPAAEANRLEAAPAEPRIEALIVQESVTVQITLSDEARRELVAEIAYLRAERRNFAPGGELEDWLHAEAEVARRIAAGRSSR